MKRILIITIAFLAGLSARAQTMADDAKTWAEGWKYAFSQEGRQNWRPEFTARVNVVLFGEGPAITGGVRIDDKRTFGLMVWQAKIYIDADPADIYTLSSGLYMRRYFHLGQKDIVALYSDFAIGAEYVYKRYGIDSGHTLINKGDVLIAFALQPGIRFRFWKNLHLFLGPSVSSVNVGFHLGVGF